MAVCTRLAIVLHVILGMTLATLQPLAAQNSRGNVCGRAQPYEPSGAAGCQRADRKPNSVGIFAADFAEIAKLPSTTALSLKVFLRDESPQHAKFHPSAR